MKYYAYILSTRCMTLLRQSRRVYFSCLILSYLQVFNREMPVFLHIHFIQCDEIQLRPF